jgi:hypothetical protein
MVLEAFGVRMSNQQLRDEANQLQGTSGYDDGVSLDVLQTMAQQAGVPSTGLRDARNRYRVWSIGDVIEEVRRGHPVVTLVHFATLPQHADSGSRSDHYIVVVGLTGSGFVINDPASSDGSGYHQLLGPSDILAAWRAASVPQAALAFLPPNGTFDLRRASHSTPTSAPATATSVPVPASSDAATVPPDDGATPVVDDPSPTDTPTPAPNAPWLKRANSWQRAVKAPTIAPPRASTPSGKATTLVLAERESADGSALPALIVVAVIGVIAMAIIKAPRSDELS